METRKDIPWYEWLYQVSSLWNILSCNYRGELWRKVVLKQSIWWHRENKYKKISITNGVKRKTLLVHRLLAITFLPNPDNKKQINHIDWNTQNNNIDNLERCTQSENLLHAYRALWKVCPSKGKFWKNSKSSKAVKQRSVDWDLVKEWDCIADVTRELWYARSHICANCRGKSKTSYGYIRTYK